ncbi:sentrin-specific protease 1-like [Metopolophium dirhodum]|uniref:sentrin-specific protease 1-like n=1 Tax=Metopolophium dirhodum TaxID=44670 RepID=UPI00298FEA05|nr:sentrin-specific protease 1-like [Metopolophium dirhodum]
MACITKWYLNDNVINDYFKLIQERDPSIYCFDTYFHEKYKKNGYLGVKRWTKKINIFSKRKLFFPINITARNFSHWILVVVDIKKNKITHYDSILKGDRAVYRDDVFKYLEQEYQEKFGESLPKNNWKKVKGDNPCQINKVDCGVFVCMYAEYISRDVAFNFCHEHMLFFRKLMAYELLTKQLV